MDALTEALSGPQSANDDRHIHGEGTPERVWRAWAGLRGLSSLSLRTLAPSGSRIVVVAPHPDDEVLGCGGTLALLARASREVLVLGLTDGEACYPGSSRWPPGPLAIRRREERLEGLRRLGVESEPLSFFIPDGDVSAVEDELSDRIHDVLRPSDVVLTTWRRDGHPDHEAAGRAAVRASRDFGCRCWEMPIWMWHWARPDDPRVPWPELRRLALDEAAVERKSRAVTAHASQLRPIAEDGLAPVLPEWALARLLRSFETFIDSESAP